MNYTEKNKLIDSLCGVALMLLLTEVFYGIVDSAFTVYNYNLANVKTTIQVVGAIFLIVAIILYIRAYKKERLSSAIYASEFLVLAILSALLPGAYIDFPYPYNMLSKAFPFIFLGYYLIKLIVIIVMTIVSRKKKGKRK